MRFALCNFLHTVRADASEGGSSGCCMFWCPEENLKQRVAYRSAASEADSAVTVTTGDF